MSRTRHGASVAQLRAAGARLADANTDLAAATEMIHALAESIRRHSAPGALAELDDSDIDPLYATPAVKDGLDRVTEISQARASTVEKINTATRTALSALDKSDDARPRLVAAVEQLFDAVGLVNETTGEQMLAIVLEQTPATVDAVVFERSDPAKLLAPFMASLNAGTEPVLRLENQTFGTWLAFGSEADRGQVLDLLHATRKAATAVRTAAAALRRPQRAMDRLQDLAEQLPTAGELLTAWLDLGTAIVDEARRQLDVIGEDQLAEADGQTGD
ncbi:MAG: hypothetical protein F4Y14_09875 [Acidobacteria bacterium]|nr:hypothetical protein [Acidobacteriota bacterium]